MSCFTISISSSEQQSKFTTKDDDGSCCSPNRDISMIEFIPATTTSSSSSFFSTTSKDDDSDGGSDDGGDDVNIQDIEQRLTNQKRIEMNKNMVYLSGGEFIMGTDKPKILIDGEGPTRRVFLSPFYIDRYEVTNEDFKVFIDSTGFITESERFGWSFVFLSAIPEQILTTLTSAVAGAEWWIPVPHATWATPEGVGSDVFSSGRARHPVVHVSWNDAVAFCTWRGKGFVSASSSDSDGDSDGEIPSLIYLPTEAQWEFAARGNKKGFLYPWGNKLLMNNRTHMANIFQGNFPISNTKHDGYDGTAPVDAFPAQNDYGLHGMIGNAWEWVYDTWKSDHYDDSITSKSAPIINPKGPSLSPKDPNDLEKTKKGGSFLCHKSYCYRYRTASRNHASADSGTSHGGFRCGGENDLNNNNPRDRTDEM